MKNNAEQRRQQLYDLLGDLPPRNRDISAKTISCTQREKYSIEELILDINGLELVPAYFVKPLNVNPPFPTILYHHSHGGNYSLGKDELISGCSYMQKPSYAEVLTQKGFAVLCIDAWCFGQRAGVSESIVFKDMLWRGKVLWGMMVYDALRALDYLARRGDVDANRIGTLGMSMGATMAWWLAALDERIRACVDICCMTDFQTFAEQGNLDDHGLYYYVPGLLKYFSTAEINALIAPRPHLSLVGLKDPLTPSSGLDRIDGELQGVYQHLGCPDNWKLLRYDVGHFETSTMRQNVLKFLSRRFLER